MWTYEKSVAIKLFQNYSDEWGTSKQQPLLFDMHILLKLRFLSFLGWSGVDGFIMSMKQLFLIEKQISIFRRLFTFV